MKMKRLTLIMRNALLFVLAAIIMAGATGFSYKAHFCHNKLSGFVLYPGLGSDKSIGCGCIADDKSDSKTLPDTRLVLRKNSCCENVTHFSKLTVESPVNVFLTNFSFLPATFTVSQGILYTDIYVEKKFIFPDIGSPPTPLVGRKLVLFLSQQRIPSVSYNC